MPISNGTRLGPYEVLAPVGAGGMGEVYKARDTRLDRIVAVKVLPDHLSSDTALRQRFEREARAISALNHPHICTLHDIGREKDVDFLVLELIEGETLAERLKRGALALPEALRHGIEIADALAKAHHAGVVHRDLKPGNIMLTRDGAKLLDFGLAAWLPDSAPSGESLSSLPTAHKSLTEKGTVLGTFQYMAPEQLEGKDVDARTDIFALGVLLYEMVTGRKAFHGASSASLIASILTHDLKPVSELDPTSPPMLDHVIRRSVAKEPDARWQTAQDVKAELEWIRNGSASEVARVPEKKARKSREHVAWSLLAVTALAALALAVGWLTSPVPERQVVRFSVGAPEGGSFTRWGAFPVFQALSPNGRHLSFAGRSREEGHRLWIRSLDSLAARSLTGTEGVLRHFWSPDGRFVAFFSDGKLKKVGLDGGPTQTLADAPSPRGGSWSREDVILFAPASRGSGLALVPAVGGEVTQVTEPDASRGEISHRWPSFLPDGRHFLYTVSANEDDAAGIYLGSLDGETPKRLFGDFSEAAYAAPGYVLFVRDGVLMAHPFDGDRLELTGQAVPIAEGVAFSGGFGLAAFSVSQNGMLAYHTSSTRQQLAWYDRDGRRQEIDQPGFYRSPALSPDGRRVAVERSEAAGQTDIWVVDLVRGTNSRLTFDPNVDWYPIWSPDGEQILFASTRSGRNALYLKSSSGSGEAELLLETDEELYPTDWSRDGRFVLYASGIGGERDIWALPLFGERQPMRIVATDFVEWRGSFSPDGKWVAYDSNETGQMEIYVQSFPPTGAKWQISVDGGQMSRWSVDGKELFFLTEEGRLMSVEIAGGADLQAGTPRPVFEIEGFIGPNLRYALSTDGQRFLIPSSPVDLDSAITVVLNWDEPLEAITSRE